MPMALALSRLIEPSPGWTHGHGPHMRLILKLTLSNEFNSTLTPNNSKGVKLDINQHVHEPSGKIVIFANPPLHLVLYLLQIWSNCYYVSYTDNKYIVVCTDKLVVIYVRFSLLLTNISFFRKIYSIIIVWLHIRSDNLDGMHLNKLRSLTINIPLFDTFKAQSIGQLHYDGLHITLVRSIYTHYTCWIELNLFEQKYKSHIIITCLYHNMN